MNRVCRFCITVTVTVTFLHFGNLFCIAVTVLVTAKYSRNLVCNDCGWDGTFATVDRPNTRTSMAEGKG